MNRVPIGQTFDAPYQIAVTERSKSLRRSGAEWRATRGVVGTRTRGV